MNNEPTGRRQNPRRPCPVWWRNGQWVAPSLALIRSGDWPGKTALGGLAGESSGSACGEARVQIFSLLLQVCAFSRQEPISSGLPRDDRTSMLLVLLCRPGMHREAASNGQCRPSDWLVCEAASSCHLNEDVMRPDRCAGLRNAGRSSGHLLLSWGTGSRLTSAASIHQRGLEPVVGCSGAMHAWTGPSSSRPRSATEETSNEDVAERHEAPPGSYVAQCVKYQSPGRLAHLSPFKRAAGVARGYTGDDPGRTCRSTTYRGPGLCAQITLSRPPSPAPPAGQSAGALDLRRVSGLLAFGAPSPARLRSRVVSRRPRSKRNHRKDKRIKTTTMAVSMGYLDCGIAQNLTSGSDAHPIGIFLEA